MNQNRHLYRSTNDRVIAGVAAGLADYLNVDPILVRILWVISVPMTGLLTAVAYLVMMWYVPLEDAEPRQPSSWQPGGAPVTGSGFAPGTTPPPEVDPQASATPGASFAAADTPPAAQYPWEAGRHGHAESWDQRGTGNAAGIAFGSLLILVGGLFAWHEMDPRVDLGLLWPAAVIVVGVLLVATSVGFRRD